MDSPPYFILLGLNGLLGALGAGLIAVWGPKMGLTDLPDERSSHRVPTPKGGGVGILAALLCTCIVLGVSPFFWVSAALLAFLGLYADLSDISPLWRLFAQCVISAILLSGLFPEPAGPAGLWRLPLWLFFIVGTANAYNFMDGIDGIAGITGLVAFGFLSYYAYAFSGDPRAGWLALSVSVACLGFLPLNLFKARVFMGDIGSLLLGFSYAALVFLMTRTLLDFICMSAFLFPFYADEVTTMVVRISAREDLTKPHRKHLYQILANEIGMPHWKISVLYGLAQVGVGLTVLRAKPWGVAVVLLLLGLFVIVFGGIRIGLQPRRRDATEAGPAVTDVKRYREGQGRRGPREEGGA